MVFLFLLFLNKIETFWLKSAIMNLERFALAMDGNFIGDF